MAASKLQLNWINVGFTPTSGTLRTFTKVTSVSIDLGGNLLPFSGDGDRYNTTIVNDFNDVSCSIATGDIASILANPPGTVGVFTATHLDAKNTAGAGAITYTLSNAVVKDPKTSGAHRQYGTGTLDFMSYSSDGVTSPLAFVVA